MSLINPKSYMISLKGLFFENRENSYIFYSLNAIYFTIKLCNNEMSKKFIKFRLCILY